MRTARPGPGKGLTFDDLFGQAQFSADGAHFVFEQPSQWLDQVEVHMFGQAADVVMALDGGGVARTGLDHVWVEGTLHEILGIGRDAAAGLLEHSDELLSHGFAFGFRVGDPGQRGEEAVGGVDSHEFHVGVMRVAAERCPLLGRLRGV